LVALAANFSRKLSENRDTKGMIRDLEAIGLLLKMPTRKLLRHLKLDGTPLATAVANAEANVA
jgi:hypothetical protein